jgi:Ca-activated chloride channel family protein
LLIISDGEDNASRYTYHELRTRLKETDLQIYCIGTVGRRKETSLGGRYTLEQIAELTGGKAFFPVSDAELDEAVTEIALELRHQYSIGYVPNGNRHDGKWHKIKVRVNQPRGLPRLNVCAKEGYYALSR